MPLKKRIFECGSCELVSDRDIYEAVNIAQETIAVAAKQVETRNVRRGEGAGRDRKVKTKPASKPSGAPRKRATPTKKQKRSGKPRLTPEKGGIDLLIVNVLEGPSQNPIGVWLVVKARGACA